MFLRKGQGPEGIGMFCCEKLAHLVAMAVEIVAGKTKSLEEL